MVESKDKIVKDENDIQTRFPYPFMGSIGLMSRRELKLFGLGVHSVRSEEIRELRFKLLSSILKKSKKIVLITSASPGEGKATLTSDLAISLAQAGKKVAIIDTDFQNSKIHEIFSTPNSPGLAEGLSDPRKIKWIFHNTQYNRIWVVPPGEINPESPLPFDVLLSEKFKPFLNKLRNNVDVILIKAPPVLSALEASIIENNCEGILFVVESGIHNDETIKQAIEKLSSSQLELKSQSQYGKKEDNIYPLSKTPGKPPKTLGIVLNKVKSKSNDKRKIKYPNSSVWKNLKSSASSVDVFSKWHMVSFFVLLFVISFSLIPSYPFNNEFLSSPPGDFLAHSAAYGLLMFSLCQVWIQNRSRILVGLTLVFLGVVFEYFQNYIVGRTFAITDIGADIFGILLGYLVSMFTQRNQLERSPIDETIYTESQSADEYRRTMTSG